MVMKLFARIVLAGAIAACVVAAAADASFAQAKKQAGRIPTGSCKVSHGYIPSGQACASAPNQYGVSQMNWCSFGALTPGIWCGGAMCPAIKC